MESVWWTSELVVARSVFFWLCYEQMYTSSHQKSSIGIGHQCASHGHVFLYFKHILDSSVVWKSKKYKKNKHWDKQHRKPTAEQIFSLIFPQEESCSLSFLPSTGPDDAIIIDIWLSNVCFSTLPWCPSKRGFWLLNTNDVEG